MRTSRSLTTVWLATRSNGGIAQSVRAPSLYLGGPWFESRSPYHLLLTLGRYARKKNLNAGGRFWVWS